MRSVFVAIILAVALAAPVLADGTVTTPAPPPARWELFQITFTTRSSGPNAALVTIGYLAADDSVTRIEEQRIEGDGYRHLLAALGTPSGVDEATLTVTLPNGSVVPDTSAIYTLRISRWLISTGRLTGVTAVPTPSE